MFDSAKCNSAEIDRGARPAGHSKAAGSLAARGALTPMREGGFRARAHFQTRISSREELRVTRRPSARQRRCTRQAAQGGACKAISKGRCVVTDGARAHTESS